LAEQLTEAVALLPKDVFQPKARRLEQPTLEQSFPVPEHIKPNAYALVNQQLAVRDGDTLRILTGLSSQVAKRIRGLIRVRDAVRCCLRSQLNGTPDADVVLAREQLNQAYDSFVSRLGPISERANTSACHHATRLVSMPTHMTAQSSNIEGQTITTHYLNRVAFEQRVSMPRTLKRPMIDNFSPGGRD
jgi:N12 class adenine-specific DNA methylase